MKHLESTIQNSADDSRGFFHTVCNIIAANNSRTWNPMEVTCEECLKTVVVKGLIAEFMAERIEKGADPERYGAYFHIMGMNADSKGGL